MPRKLEVCVKELTVPSGQYHPASVSFSFINQNWSCFWRKNDGLLTKNCLFFFKASKLRKAPSSCAFPLLFPMLCKSYGFLKLLHIFYRPRSFSRLIMLQIFRPSSYAHFTASAVPAGLQTYKKTCKNSAIGFEDTDPFINPIDTAISFWNWTGRYYPQLISLNGYCRNGFELI